MSQHNLIAWLIIGVVAGWLAGLIVRGRGFGLIGDIILGIIGAFIGGWLAGKLHVHIGSGIVSSIVTATVGAIVLAAIGRLIRRA